MGLTRKIRRIRMRYGGMTIQGAQGCVTIPSLMIDQRKTRNANYVTKLFFTEDEFDKEKAQNDKVLKLVDPKGEFTSATYNTNTIDLKKLDPKEVANCSSLKGKDLTKLKYLNMRFLGKSLQSIIDDQKQFDKEEVRNILTSFAILASKVYEMNKKDFFHNDLHLGNVMYDKQYKKIYLIDFGFLGPPIKSELTDLLGICVIVKTFISTVLFSKNNLSSEMKDVLKTFLVDLSLVMSQAGADPDIKHAQLKLVTALTDFYKIMSQTAGRRKTRKNKRV